MYVSAVGAAVARDQRPPQREAPRELARAEVRGVHLVNVAAAQLCPPQASPSSTAVHQYGAAVTL